MILEIINYVLAAILIGVTIAWLVLIRSMQVSFRDTPYLEKFENRSSNEPKVSIILPARNEENFIAKCLDSLLNQDYKNFEIIAIDDSSEDRTGQIINDYSNKDSRIIHVTAKEKPQDWVGKNWACMEGYQKATGDLLLFTDSDTQHAKNVISLAVGHLLSLNIDALTVIPKMQCLDFWTKITLPMISTFLHTRFSALRVNDSSKKTGYFFGSFYLIKREIYESVGTHEGVKHEIVEDGALGRKVKELGFKIRMVRGEKFVQAIWARDWSTLWNALKRLMIPLYLQSRLIAIGIFFAVLFLLFIPFPVLTYSMIFLNQNFSFSLLLIVSAIASVSIYYAAVLETKIGLSLKVKYAMFGPIGSFIVVCGFLSGIIQANSKTSVSWRGRTYSLKDKIQNSISV